MLRLLADPSQAVDITTLAAAHPFTALALVLIPSLFGFAPSLLNRMKQKSSPAPATTTTATAQVDATGQLLAQLVAGLERRAEEADRRAEATEAKHQVLEVQHYELREQLRDARSKIAALEAEIETMRQRLIRGQSA